MKNDLLMELGFDETMHDVYIALISFGRGTIKALQGNYENVKKYSYSQIYNALTRLRRINFVEEQQGEEKTFFAISPTTVFESIREKKNELISKTSNSFQDLFKRTNTDLGVCTFEINRFHFSSVEMGFQIIDSKFLENAKKEIIFLAVPPIILKKLSVALINAYNRGVTISIHYSKYDFEELPSYIEIIKPYVNKANVRIIQRQYRVHEACAVNDQYTRIAQLLIDGESFISFPYYRSGHRKEITQYNVDFLEGFTHAPTIISGILGGLTQNPIIDSWVSIPTKEAQVLELLKQEKKIQKSELAKNLGLSGTSLKKILDRLERSEGIKIIREEKEKGRPMEWVYYEPKK